MNITRQYCMQANHLNVRFMLRSLSYQYEVNWLLFHADMSMSGDLKSNRPRAASKRASNTTYG